MYRYLSTRLVTQNGILPMGVTSLGILIVTGGRVALLVVLYSINVFLTFSMSLLGLCIYWWQHRRQDARWRHRLPLSLAGLIVAASILFVTLIEKFSEGGWMTVLITGTVIAFCLLNHGHYASIKKENSHRRSGAELDRLSRRRSSTPARSRRADRGVRGGIKSKRRRLCLAVGAPRISGALQEFHFYERAHGGRQELRRQRKFRARAARGRSRAPVLHQLLPQQQSGCQILPGVRHRFPSKS
jgi:uncharacterized membrane protein SirB2